MVGIRRWQIPNCYHYCQNPTMVGFWLVGICWLAIVITTTIIIFFIITTDLSRLIRQRFMIDEVERRTSRALQREQAINFSNSDLASHCSEKQIMTWYATRKVYFLHFWLIQMDSDIFRFSAAISIPVDVTPGGAKHPIAQQLEEKLQKTICYLYQKYVSTFFGSFLIVWSKKIFWYAVLFFPSFMTFSGSFGRPRKALT